MLAHCFQCGGCSTCWICSVPRRIDVDLISHTNAGLDYQLITCCQKHGMFGRNSTQRNMSSWVMKLLPLFSMAKLALLFWRRACHGVWSNTDGMSSFAPIRAMQKFTIQNWSILSSANWKFAMQVWSIFSHSMFHLHSFLLDQLLAEPVPATESVWSDCLWIVLTLITVHLCSITFCQGNIAVWGYNCNCLLFSPD